MLDPLPFVLASASGALYLLSAMIRARKEQPNAARVAQDWDRLGRFGPVFTLQEATNRHHFAAIRSKSIFQAVGLALMVLGPAALTVGAFAHHEDTGPTSTALFFQLLSIGCLAGAVLMIRRPTARWTRDRMRAETLRLHTHICLAGLPPYGGRDQAAQGDSAVARVDSANIEELRREIRSLITALEAAELHTAASTIDRDRASTYDQERIQEQAKYFPRSVDTLKAWLDRSGQIGRGALALAFAAAFVRWLASANCPPTVENIARSVIEVCVAAITLTLVARSTFGWEVRMGLYETMLPERDQWLRIRDDLRSNDWNACDDPNWQARFRALAKLIELAMAREALHWISIAERDMYEPPL
jgi:hypothetical protein